MAFIARHSGFFHGIEPYRAAAPVAVQPRPGLLRRIFDAIMENRQQRAERDIDRFVATHGRRMTDSLEREINNRMLGDGWSARR